MGAPPERTWGRWDIGALAALAVLAAGLRFHDLARPPGEVWDEFYVWDACTYFRGDDPSCGGHGEVGASHPPLAKWLIGLGIQLVGHDPRGWRVASAVAGTLTVLAVYLLARDLLRSVGGAALAGLLLALDPLHLVLSRTAMLDVFVTLFGVVAVLCFVRDHRDAAAGAARSALPSRWLLLEGLACGAAVASKWSAIPLVLALLLATAWSRLRRSSRGSLLSTAAGLGTAFVVLPATVYLLSYLGREPGPVLALPWTDGSWLGGVVAQQADMLRFHLSLEGDSPYASPPWSWPLLRRPVVMYFGTTSPGRYAEVLATGNPLVWWPAGLVVLVMAGRLAARRASWAERVVLLGVAGTYLPWLVLSAQRQQDFLYYLLPTVPFLALALAVACTAAGRRYGSALGVATVLAAVVPLVLWYPVLTARPVDEDGWRQRVLFTDCGPRATAQPWPPLPGTDVLSRTGSGWCWA